MTKQREGWIRRRGQEDALTAVALVLERQPHEQVQQLADELIEDSPYQARQEISDASVEELAQGIRTAGFQGVLIVRPHSGRQDSFQLVYGHRRRVAWRRVCDERGEPCVLPVVVRAIDDMQMLMIGAQENLQRQDLDPVEESQIVAWAERMLFDKNQAEIGAILGKSSDWVSTRSRIHRLPEPLKAILQQRPRAVKQVLELAGLYGRHPEHALRLAARVARDGLTVERLHALIQEAEQAPVGVDLHSDELHNRRAGTTIVQNGTICRDDSSFSPRTPSEDTSGGLPDFKRSDVDSERRAVADRTHTAAVPPLLDQLNQAVTLLKCIADDAAMLPITPSVLVAVGAAEHALLLIRQRLAA